MSTHELCQRLVDARKHQIDALVSSQTKEGIITTRIDAIQEETKYGIIQLSAVDITIHTMVTSQGVEKHVVHTNVHTSIQ